MSDFQNPGARSIKDWKKAERHGAGEWLAERFSSLVLFVLLGWAIYAVLCVAGTGYDGVKAYMAAPLNQILAGLLFIVSIWHSHMGLNVIIDDYFPSGFSRKLLQMVVFVGLGAMLIGGGYGLFLLAQG